MTFEEFAAARLGAVVRFAAVLAGERALAEDIVQEVLIRAHARWDQIGRPPPRYWSWPCSGRPAARLPSAKSVATAMLTAFDSVRGDVEYETQTGYNHGVLVDEYRSWTWPVQPVAGQRQLSRTRYSGISPHSAVVKLSEDRGVELVTPPRGVGMVRGQVTMVCFLGSGQTECGNIRPGTWSRFTGTVPGGSDVGPGGLFGPSTLVHGIATGAWRVTGRTQLDGQQAIELSETDRGQDTNILEPLPVRLWVNAQTYLPPTAANLALLRVPIPAGYPRR
jgi:hypothetical protein